MVEGLCRGLLRNAGEAEDAAQQTFLSAYRALIGGTEPREPGAWLAAIARNECLARIRTRMREPLPVEGLESEEARDDPVAEALRRADLDALWAAIRELPEQQREALLLREFSGLSYEELAVALGVSGPAVESLLFRARTRVRAQLKEAFASVGWLSDGLARLLSAGGAAKVGSVPVVAKIVTAGVGVAVVAGTAVVGERRVTPQRPHRTHHATVQSPVAPQAQAPASVGAALTPAAVTHVVRNDRRVERPSSHHGRGGEDGNGAGGEHGHGAVPRQHRADEHPQHGAGHRPTGDRGDHGSSRHEAEARDTAVPSDVGEVGAEPDGSGQPAKSGSDPNGNSDSRPNGSDRLAQSPPSATQVTQLLPQDGRGLPAGN
ncbi:MAG: RNA polymerase sigma factor [Actinobacteria bacterium]|nr:MAG: RNA polymerase sigma factor [Actinomycetota bacterium]